MLTLTAVVSTAAVLSAQLPEQSAPVFEVASVKLNSSGAPVSTLRMPAAGNVTIVNAPLRLIINNAFGVWLGHGQTAVSLLRTGLLAVVPSAVIAMLAWWEGLSLTGRIVAAADVWLVGVVLLWLGTDVVRKFGSTAEVRFVLEEWREVRCTSRIGVRRPSFLPHSDSRGKELPVNRRHCMRIGAME